MAKGSKRAAKGSQDFAKKKLKVGKKLAKAQNETTVDVKVRQLALPAQKALEDHQGEPGSDSKLTLQVRHTCARPAPQILYHCVLPQPV